MLMVADHHMKHERHFVFADDRAWHHLWLRTDRPGVPLANLILRDSLVGLRHEAAVRFDRWLGDGPGPPPAEIGRASCRERVCQYVSNSVVAVSLKNKITQIDTSTST